MWLLGCSGKNSGVSYIFLRFLFIGDWGGRPVSWAPVLLPPKRLTVTTYYSCNCYPTSLASKGRFSHRFLHRIINLPSCCTYVRYKLQAVVVCRSHINPSLQCSPRSWDRLQQLWGRKFGGGEIARTCQAIRICT